MNGALNKENILKLAELYSSEVYSLMEQNFELIFEIKVVEAVKNMNEKQVLSELWAIFSASYSATHPFLVEEFNNGLKRYFEVEVIDVVDTKEEASVVKIIMDEKAKRELELNDKISALEAVIKSYEVAKEASIIKETSHRIDKEKFEAKYHEERDINKNLLRKIEKMK